MNKRENQQAVLAAVNNEFALFLDRGGFTILDEDLMPSESIGYDNVENFTEIFQSIKRYIANNRHKFRLGGNSSTENVCDGYVEGQRPEDRPWWSPLITPEEEGRGRSQGPHGVCRTRKIMKGDYFIHPAALTGAQYEELKKLIPGACKVKGCCNSYADPNSFRGNVSYSMVGNVCQYHHLFPSHRPPFFAGKNCGNNSDENNNQPPPTNPHHPSFPQPTTQSIQFTIGKVEKPYPEADYFRIQPKPTIAVNGTKIAWIVMVGDKSNDAFQNGDFSVGNTITVTDVQLSRQEVGVENGSELFIGKYFRDIQVISRDNSPNPNPNPPNSNEVRQKNHQLAKEEDDLLLLAAELLEIIDIKNEKICQEAKQLGLNLPEIPSGSLDYFQEEFFTSLEETQPLNSPHNQQISADNEKIRQRKLNLKNNIYQIYNSNVKKLTEKKQAKNNPSSPSENELAKLKKQIIEKINKVLTDPDNLRRINLTTLTNGKYQNWENDIEALTTEDEVIAYANAFLAALKEAGAKENEEEKNHKTPPATSPKGSPQNNTIDNNTKKIISSLPLTAAKNVAKTKIRELFQKYKPDLEKIKEIWKGEKNWMSYLEKCDSSEKVATFLEKLEQAIIQQNQSQENNTKNKDPVPLTWILPLIIISLVAIIGLVIIIKLCYKRKKIK